MGLLQRNDDGTVPRDADGPVIGADNDDPCCCGPPDGGLCPRATEVPECGPYNGTSSAGLPYTLKVVIADTENDTSCYGTNPGVKITGGSINRTYYVGLATTPGSSPPYNFGGPFFAGASSTGSDPLTGGIWDGFTTCTGAPDHSFDDFFLSMNIQLSAGGPGTDQVVDAVMLGPDRDLFRPSVYATPSAPPKLPHDQSLCDNVITIDGRTDFTFTGTKLGTMTITPCPPCAVMCGAHPCASITFTGSSGLTDGAWPYRGFAQWGTSGASPTATVANALQAAMCFGAVPAGCVWVFSEHEIGVVGGIASGGILYVWFDGADYVALIAGGEGATGAGAPCLPQYFFSSAGVQLACTDGMLTGTMNLAAYAGNPDADSTAIVTFGACECFGEATIDITSATVAYFNGGASLPAGNYVMKYKRGATQFFGNTGDWYVVGSTFGITNIIGQNGSGEGVITQAPGDNQDYTSQALAEAGSAGMTVAFTTLADGPIGVRLDDSADYSDNFPGSPNPTWELCLAT